MRSATSYTPMSFSTVCLPMASIFTAVFFLFVLFWIFLYACGQLEGQTLISDQVASSPHSNTILIGILRKRGFLLIPKDIKYYKQALKGIIWDGDIEQICWKLTGSSHLVFGGGKKGKWAPIYEKRMAGFLSVIFCLCMLAYVPQSSPLDPLLLSKLFSWEIQLGHIQNLNLLRRD